MTQLSTPAGNDFWEIKPRTTVVMALAFSLGTSLVVFQVDRVFIAVVVVFIAAGRIFSNRTRFLLALASFFAAGVLNAGCRAPQPEPGDISFYAGNNLAVSGTISQLDQMKNERGIRIVLSCRRVSQESSRTLGWRDFRKTRQRPEQFNELAVCGRLRADLYFARSKSAEKNKTRRAEFKEGDSITIHGKVCSIARGSPTRFQGLQTMLLRRRIFSQLHCNISQVQFPAEAESGHGRELVSSKDGLEACAEYWRRSLLAFHQLALGKADGSLLTSIVLGDRAVKLDRASSDSFRASGLSHVLAASGFNLSIVAASIYFVLRLFIGNIWISNLICLAGMSAFVLTAGPSPSVMRAYLMGALLLASRCFGRTVHLPAVLALAMSLVLAADPWSVSDVGFQLSYISTAGMILGAGDFTQLSNKLLKRLPESLRAIIAATIVAQFSVLPVQFLYFKEFTPYCLPANIMVVPMVAPLTVAGFATSLIFVAESACSCGHWISSNIDRLCFFPLELMRYEVSTVAGLPMAQLSTAQVSLPSVLLYYAILLLFPVLKANGKLKEWLMLFLLALAIMLVSMAMP